MMSSEAEVPVTIYQLLDCQPFHLRDGLLDIPVS